MQPDKKRYEALDGWRGISACLVVLYHFCTVSHIYQARLIRAGFLWVDFFFVLSGFIITANYRDRLMNGFPARKFLFLRLGRIYPLHIFMLALTVGHEILKPILLHEPAFSSCDRSVRTLIANILLLHSVQGSDCMSWNAPSWSISAEWFAYALFALGIRVLKSRVWMVELALTIVSPIILACYHSDLNITSRLSLLRCLYGFSLGAICYRVHMAYLDRGVYNRWAMTFVEIALLLAGFYLAIYMHQKLSILAPFLFASMILVFAQESGAISELLKTCPMKLLGVLSYPIYMAHFFIQRLVYNAAALAGKKLHASAFTRKNWFGKDVKMINTSLWQGDVLMVAILVIVIPASYVTWQYIEVPAHNWFRRRAQTWFPERNGPWGFSHAFGGS